MILYKADGESEDAFTLYADTGDSLYCEIHHPSGDVGDVQVVSDDYPIERIKGQFGAEQIEPDEIGGLFGVKAYLLALIEGAGGEASTEFLECDTKAEMWTRGG